MEGGMVVYCIVIDCLRFIFLDLEIDFLSFDVKFETKLSKKNHLILDFR